MNSSDAPATAALSKIFISWLAVGVSQMSPLQFVQFVAAIFAIVYTGLQTYKLLREMWASKGAK